MATFSGQDLTERGCSSAVHFLQPHSHSLATWHSVIWLEQCDQMAEPLPTRLRLWSAYTVSPAIELVILKTDILLTFWTGHWSLYIYKNLNNNFKRYERFSDFYFSTWTGGEVYLQLCSVVRHAVLFCSKLSYIVMLFIIDQVDKKPATLRRLTNGLIGYRICPLSFLYDTNVQQQMTTQTEEVWGKGFPRSKASKA